MVNNHYKIASIGAAKILSLAASQFPRLAFLTTGPFGYLASYIVERFLNWCLSNGLMFINVKMTGFETDQERKAFEKAIDDAYKILDNKKDLTQGEMDAIDNEVIRAFDRFVIFGKLRSN